MDETRSSFVWLRRAILVCDAQHMEVPVTARIIDGKSFAEGLRGRIADHVQRMKTEHGITPGLAVVIVGHDPGSQVYVAQKAKQTVDVGMHSEKYELPETTSEAEVLALVQKLNADPAIHGILVQLPVPPQIDAKKIIETISPDKDVDCFTPASVGKLVVGLPGPVSCTPLGCLMLLRDTLGDLAGLHAVVVGRSNLVGKPMAQLLLRENCTVTMAHSRTRDLPAVVREADIVIAAVGRPEMIKGHWIKPGATVIDVGINRIDAPERGEGRTRLLGDVAYAEAAAVAGAITPVPGGVGPMTIACLLANTITTASLINGLTPPSDLTA
jgi:methylenetetrahydrofolate dehydrogenase (NADP+)/methenyltetrahydrofolate cyclohydrolase